VAFTVCAAFVILPWSVRASRVAGEVVLVQEGGRAAMAFYAASRSDVDQTDRDQVWGAWESSSEARRLADAQTTEELREAKRAVRASILRNITRDPAAFALSRARAIPRLFVTTFGEVIPANASFSSAVREGRWALLLMKGFVTLVFAMAPLLLAVGGLPACARKPQVRFAAGVWVYTVLIYAPMWIMPRYGQPAVPLLLVCAAIGGKQLVSMIRRPSAWP
jgi:hypothetical protein